MDVQILFLLRIIPSNSNYCYWKEIIWTNFYGIIPNDIWNLNTNFQYFLNLGWTNFTGVVPRGFGKLKESQYFFCLIVYDEIDEL